MQAFFNSFKKLLTGSILACLPLANLQAQEAADSTIRRDTVLNSERLEESFTSNWTTLIQQAIPGMDPDLFYRKQDRPLIVLDGVPLSTVLSAPYALENAIFSSTEIESVAFTQGPEAVVQYGQRAANGALIIQTKDGELNQGFQTGVYSGIAYTTPFNENSPSAMNWQENAYLNWSNTTHSVHAGYSSRLKSIEEYMLPGSVTAGFDTVEANHNWSHALNAQLKSRYNEQLTTLISGVYNKGVSQQFNLLHTSLTYQPVAWMNLQWSGGANLFSSHTSIPLPYSQEIILEQTSTNKETDLRLRFNHSLTSEIRLSAETGGAYYQQKFNALSSLNSGPADEPNTEQYELTNNYYRAFAYAGLKFKEWAELKGGIQYQSYTSSNKLSADRFNPYVSLKLQAGKIIPENRILSTLDFHTSYGQVQLTPAQRQYASRLPVEKMSFQTRLKAGFFKDRLIFETAYFNDKNQQAVIIPVSVDPASGYSEIDLDATTTDTYSGFESNIRAKVLKVGSFQWTTGINSLIIKQKNLVDIAENDANIIIAPVPGQEYPSGILSGEANPWKWQTGLFNRLNWKGFHFSTQLSLQNSTEEIYSITTGEFYSKTSGDYGVIYGSPYPDLTTGTANIRSEKYYLLNLQEISLSYTLPASLLTNSFFRKVNIGLSGRNLLLKSNTSQYRYVYYEGASPIVNPQQKLLSFNLGLHF